MGSFYGSIQIRTDERESVLRAVEAIAAGTERRFLCGPPLSGWVGVYPDQSGQSSSDADAIAARLPSDVFYLCVHDDDIFWCRFYRHGRLVDEYLSTPGDHLFMTVDRREVHAWGPDWGQPPRLYCVAPVDRIVAAVSADAGYAVTDLEPLHPPLPGVPIPATETSELRALPGCDRIGDGAAGYAIFAEDSSRVLFVPHQGGEIVARALPSGEQMGRWPSPFQTFGRRVLHRSIT